VEAENDCKRFFPGAAQWRLHLGPEVEAFESEWAAFCDESSGGSWFGHRALTLALIASGLWYGRVC